MSSSLDLIIKNGKCFIDGQLKKADIAISNGAIKEIGNIEVSNQKVLDATNLTILPGIIDTQVHFREPGSTDVEDLESGSKAAVLGGVTSVFERGSGRYKPIMSSSACSLSTRSSRFAVLYASIDSLLC